MKKVFDNQKRILILGGDTFIGPYLIEKLAQEGAMIVASVNNREANNYLRTYGEVGQVRLIKSKFPNQESVAKLLQGIDTVIFLSNVFTTNYVRDKKLKVITWFADLANELKIPNFIYISPYGGIKNIDDNFRHIYQKTVREKCDNSVIIRTNFIYSLDNPLLKKLRLFSRIKMLPVIGSGTNIFQPIHIGDVTQSIVNAIDNPDAKGRTFDIGGLNQYTLLEIIQLYQKFVFPSAKIVHLSPSLCRAMAFSEIFLSKPPFFKEEVSTMQNDLIIKPHYLGVQNLGVVPKDFKDFIKEYNHLFHK